MIKLCLTIGISDASHLGILPGAVVAAKDFGFWAQQSGFITTIITDESAKVTTKQIKNALLELINVNDEIEHLIIHFAGHGYRTGAEQHVWLLSDWFEENCAISVESLKRGLYGRGIRNLSIFSDACRSMPNSIDADSINKDGLIRKGSVNNDYPKIDRFNAAMDGEVTYMIKGSGGVSPRCVFSTVLIEGLYGLREEAYFEYLPDCVVPESLALYSEYRMTEIGRSYGLICKPECTISPKTRKIIYFNRATTQIQSVPVIDWPPPPSKNDANNNLDKIKSGTIEQSNSYYQSHGVRGLTNRIKSSLLGTRVNRINLIIIGLKDAERIWCSHKIYSLNKRSYYISVPINSSAQVIAEFPGGVFMSCIVYSNLITYLSMQYYGFKGWTCFERNTNRAFIYNTLSFLEKFRSGEIRASEVDEIAVVLRSQKHCNPVMGSIASYLYDYTGDIDSIRRMAYFYCCYNQDIPYDVALMSFLTKFSTHKERVIIPGVKKRKRFNPDLPEWVNQETTEVSGRVAGYWPWLNQGWQFTEGSGGENSLSDPILRSVMPHLLPYEFSAFDEAGALILINEFKLEYKIWMS